MSGESEAKIRELFEQALEMAPCIVYVYSYLLTIVAASNSPNDSHIPPVLQIHR
jgi:SpoVK/Ycf46/Vps4 family AAA+-type ATPase